MSAIFIFIFAFNVDRCFKRAELRLFQSGLRFEVRLMIRLGRSDAAGKQKKKFDRFVCYNLAKLITEQLWGFIETSKKAQKILRNY